MAEEILNVEQSHEQNDWHGQHYPEVCASLALGKDLYNEIRTHLHATRIMVRFFVQEVVHLWKGSLQSRGIPLGPKQLYTIFTC